MKKGWGGVDIVRFKLYFCDVVVALAGFLFYSTQSGEIRDRIKIQCNYLLSRTL